MGTFGNETQAGDDDLILLTRASMVDAPHVAPAHRGKPDALITVDAYAVSPESDVVEFLQVRAGADARPAALHYVPPHLVGRDAVPDDLSSARDANRSGYYEVGTNRLFIDQPVRRSDLALYQVGDLRRAGVIR